MEGRDRSGLDFTGLGFELKGVDVKKRLIEGWASTADLDDNDDIVEAGACQFKEAKSVLPFIGHKHDELPVGIPLEVRYDADGRLFTSTRIHNTHAGDDLLTVASERAAAGMPLGISIGYPHATVKATFERKGGRLIRRIKSLDLVEFSFTPMPVNDSAVVTAVKSKAWERKALEQMSDEEKRAEINEAIRNRAAPPAVMPLYVYVTETYDDFVIVTDGDDFWKVPFTVGADGEVVLGAQVAVVRGPWTEKTATDAEVKAARAPLETKAGRTLSADNLGHVRNAHEAMHAMATAAGIDLHEIDDETPADTATADSEDDDSPDEGKAKHVATIDEALRELALAQLAA